VPVDILVERRQYLGACHTEEELQHVFQYFRELKPEFDSIIRNQKLLPWHDRKGILDYVEHFYVLTGDKEIVKKEFLRGCE
jgi:hypothetical protein